MERFPAVRAFTVAVILAGGSGCRAAAQCSEQRVSSDLGQTDYSARLPKQFWLLGGRPVWQHSWLRYAQHPAIDRVCVVWPPAFLEMGRQQLRQYAKNCAQNLAPTYSLAGGRDRCDSSFRALKFCRRWQTEQRRVQVLLHDAARPLVSKRIIDETLEKLNFCDAVVCALPATDSVFVAKDQKVSEILKRDSVMQSQTPQGFALETIYRAFCLYDRKKLPATDDIAIVRQYLPSTNIHVVQGEAANRKLTEAADLDILACYYRLAQPE